MLISVSRVLLLWDTLNIQRTLPQIVQKSDIFTDRESRIPELVTKTESDLWRNRFVRRGRSPDWFIRSLLWGGGQLGSSPSQQSSNCLPVLIKDKLVYQVIKIAIIFTGFCLSYDLCCYIRLGGKMCIHVLILINYCVLSLSLCYIYGRSLFVIITPRDFRKEGRQRVPSCSDR